jgi:hypothetical protein
LILRTGPASQTGHLSGLVVYVRGPALSFEPSPISPLHANAQSVSAKAKRCRGGVPVEAAKRVALRSASASSFLPPSPPLSTQPLELAPYQSLFFVPESVDRSLVGRVAGVGPGSAAAAMEPLEVAITIIFDALLLVFMVKLFFAMFQMKLVVILFYLVILLFAMAFSGRAPSSF